MPRKLIIKELGPIKEAEIEQKPLTILVGPQASGKSLAAIISYFFESLETEFLMLTPNTVLKWIKENPKSAKDRINDLLHLTLTFPIRDLANDNSSIHFIDESKKINWEINIKNDDLYINEALIEDIMKWIKSLRKKSKTMLFENYPYNYIFIPAERIIFSINNLWISEIYPPILKPHRIELLLCRFNAILQKIYHNYRSSISHVYSENIPMLEKDALSSNIVFDFSRGFLGVINGLYPLIKISSGQAAAWSIFMIFSILGKFKPKIFIEEPEINLHPDAQVAVAKAISLLVNQGSHIFITTHSPYIIYAINVMLQRFKSFKGNVPKEEQFWLNPDNVSAYCTSQGKFENIIDREDTGLIGEEELERAANELGKEFDKLLNIK